jgi:prepilin peptidase CpaA
VDFRPELDLTVTRALINLAPLLVMMFVAAWIDLRERRIPNWLTLLLMVTGLTHGVFASGSHGLMWSALGLLAGAAIPFVLFAIGAMGGGDVKLMAGVGAWVGAGPVLLVLVCEKVIGLGIVLAQALYEGRLVALLSNSAVVAVNILHIKEVGVEHVSGTGRGCRSVSRPLPFAVPALLAVLFVLAFFRSIG